LLREELTWTRGRITQSKLPTNSQEWL